MERATVVTQSRQRKRLSCLTPNLQEGKPAVIAKKLKFKMVLLMQVLRTTMTTTSV